MSSLYDLYCYMPSVDRPSLSSVTFSFKCKKANQGNLVSTLLQRISSITDRTQSVLDLIKLTIIVTCQVTLIGFWYYIFVVCNESFQNSVSVTSQRNIDVQKETDVNVSLYSHIPEQTLRWNNDTCNKNVKQ